MYLRNYNFLNTSEHNLKIEYGYIHMNKLQRLKKKLIGLKRNNLGKVKERVEIYNCKKKERNS